MRVIAEQGVPIVAYTDARVANSMFRIRKLGLQRFLSALYTPVGRFVDLPIEEDDFVHALPAEARKPNPLVLKDIAQGFNVEASQTIYVGDSLTKDVYMAKEAGCLAAWARYGTVYNSALWPMLVKVSHWTSDDIEQEKAFQNAASAVRADFVLDRFQDLLQCVEFGEAATCLGARIS